MVLKVPGWEVNLVSADQGHVLIRWPRSRAGPAHRQGSQDRFGFSDCVLPAAGDMRRKPCLFSQLLPMWPMADIWLTVGAPLRAF